MTHQQGFHGPSGKVSKAEEVNAFPQPRQTQVITLLTPLTLETNNHPQMVTYLDDNLSIPVWLKSAI